MFFTCTSCPKKFGSETDLLGHASACAKKTSCSVSLPSGKVTAYKNSSHQWLCCCDLTKCHGIFPTGKALQTHILRDANADTQWKACWGVLM